VGDDGHLRRTIVRRIFLAQTAILLLCVALIIVFSIFTQEAGTLPFSFLLGALGGSVSLIRRLPSEAMPNLQGLAVDRVSTIAPLMFGGIMAIVTYLLFMSGILTGDGGTGLFTSNLFPNFTRPSIPAGETLTVPRILQIRPSSVMDVGKLLVWSFLAGHSERFVASVLSTLEQRGGGEKT
jgi:hypothetical protein